MYGWETDMLPEFTNWPTKGYPNLKRIIILGAGLFTNSFLLPFPVVVYWFTLCQLGVGFGLDSHARHLNCHIRRAIFSGLMCGRQTHMPPEPHARIHEFVDKRVPQSQENSYSQSWFVHELFSSCLSSVLDHLLAAECRVFGLRSYRRDFNRHCIMQYFLGRCLVDKPTWRQNLTPVFTNWPLKRGFSHMNTRTRILELESKLDGNGRQFHLF